jgi:hypothetical protein
MLLISATSSACPFSSISAIVNTLRSKSQVEIDNGSVRPWALRFPKLRFISQLREYLQISNVTYDELDKGDSFPGFAQRTPDGTSFVDGMELRCGPRAGRSGCGVLASMLWLLHYQNFRSDCRTHSSLLTPVAGPSNFAIWVPISLKN